MVDRNPATFAPILNLDGEPFDQTELSSIAARVQVLGEVERAQMRRDNANAIASSEAERLLLISGPGTGKSTLIRARIREWLARYPDYEIRVATFVKRLVVDLREDIEQATDLEQDEKNRVYLSTLHHLARSIVERSHGSTHIELRRNVQVIATTFWEKLTWNDVLSICKIEHEGEYKWETVEVSLYDDDFISEEPWISLRQMHLRLQKFYNALTFPELILVAAKAVQEHPELAIKTLFIVDEFQDFNLAEESLIRALSANSPGLLLAGDDDQVLYDSLRRARASIIRDYYNDRHFANAMLPFCSRCGFHICQVASAFLEATATGDSINKLMLPFHHELGAEKVSVIFATKPQLGVNFIHDWLKDHADDIRHRQAEIEAGSDKEPFLLILTPAKNLNYFNVGGARENLLESLAPFLTFAGERGSDFWKVRDYYALAGDLHQNYFLRRVLYYEEVDHLTVANLLRRCFDEEVDFVDLGDSRIHDLVEKAKLIRVILESAATPEEQVARIGEIVPLLEPTVLVRDLDEIPIGKLPSPEEDSPRLGQAEIVGAVQLETIVGAKGMSAEHVFVLGCDETNMNHVTRNAFYVALTRARQSLTLLACMEGGGAEGLHRFVHVLPNEHITVTYLKSDGSVSMDTIGELVDHLARWAYAKARAREEAAARKKNKKPKKRS